MNAREPQPIAHAKWEYTWIRNYETREAGEEANRLGSEGWEMCGFKASVGGFITAFFKRPVY